MDGRDRCTPMLCDIRGYCGEINSLVGSCHPSSSFQLKKQEKEKNSNDVVNHFIRSSVHSWYTGCV